MPGPLYHSPARVIMELLVAHDYGVDIDVDEDGEWPIFVNHSADKPDNTIRIQDTTGVSHGDCQIDGEREEDYGLQIMVRASRQDIGFNKIHRIAMFLDRLIRERVQIDTGETGTGSNYTEYLVAAVSRSTSIIYVGVDVPQGKREIHTTNALATIRMCC